MERFRRACGRGFLVLFVLSVLFLPAERAQSGPFDDFVGIITDPLKVGSAGADIRAAVEKFALMADMIEARAYLHAKDLLEQTNGILNSAAQNVVNIIDRGEQSSKSVIHFAFETLDSTSREMMLNFQKATLCTAEVVSQNLKENLAEALTEVGEPTLSIGFIKIRGKWKPGDIKDPMESFDLVRKGYEARLAVLKPSSDAREITRVYNEIRRNASITICHYDGSYDAYTELMDIELEYRRRTLFWLGRIQTRF